MHPKLLVGCLALGAAGFWLLPAEVRACTCSPSVIDLAVPKDGAQNVPLNAALQIMGAFAQDSISLEEVSGHPIEFTLHSGPTPSCPGTSAELVPNLPLSPETTYVVRVRPLYPESGAGVLTFTTGLELLPDVEPEAPSGGAASVVFDVPLDGVGCGSGRVNACVSVDESENIEVLARRGDEVVLRWMLSASESTFGLSEQPDCIELRRLTATGRRSAPVKICGDALRPRRFRESDRSGQGVLRCSEGVIGRSDCSVAFAAPGEPVHALSASGVLMLALAWRRRRTVRQNQTS